MALIVADRVREYSTTTGTGTLTLSGAPLGYQTFSGAIGNGNTTYYVISNPGINEWEVGVGTVNAGVLSRDTVLSSSTGSLVSFTAGNKDVFCSYPAERSVFTDNAATLTNKTISGSDNTLSNIGNSSLTNSSVTIGSTSVSLGATQTSFTGLTGITSTAITDSGLTSGRVTFASTGGLLADSADLAWNGSTLAVTGAVTASSDSTFSSTGALKISSGTTAQRPAGTAGQLRFNTSTSEFEGYNGSAWASVGGSAISNDTSTASNLYPIFVTATSGTALNVYTSNAKYLYNPSTGALQAPEMVANNGMLVHANTVTSDYTVPDNYNVVSAGPISVASGVTVTLPASSIWTVV